MPSAKERVAEVLVKEHGLSVGRACRAVRLSRTAWYRQPRSSPERDRPVVDALNRLVGQQPRRGFWKLHNRLRLDGEHINHKRLHRVYCAMKLNLPRRTKRRLATRSGRSTSWPTRSTAAVSTARPTSLTRATARCWHRDLDVHPEPARHPGDGAAHRDARQAESPASRQRPELTSVAFTEWSQVLS
jgi:hypothetical protein